ncbi:PREDICTED: uncharacterized protein LOC106818898 [Priapulus caudatus]|uniref:Uncharacterized protein LOC106818898 n=1 Tax=Priapulus caudatus TaxID=37621 RepID=A0ABM1F3N3_PRICU|nr:PREDICTED: uncharacterized protein LOC106818898 [Priapulus caudatus]
MDKRIVILGAGPTGLGAATRLHELGHRNWLLLEGASEPGGLASSVRDDNGFLWDMGGHVIFSHYKYFDDVITTFVPDWLHHRREAYVWMCDRFIPYPLQNNIHRLPPLERESCLQGLIDAQQQATPTPTPTKPATFQDWIDRNFGKGLARLFLNPYNFKVWAYRPSAMTADWVGERVAKVDVKRIVDNIASNRDDVAWGPNSQFSFPENGGTGAIWRAVYDHLPADNCRLSSEVVRIYADEKLVELRSGETLAYDALVATAPLDSTLRLLSGSRLAAMKSLADIPVHSSSHIVGLGLRGQPPAHVRGKCWLYFPEDDCPFYRATVFSHYSPNNVPQPGRQWSLMMEVSESPEKPLAGDVVQATVDGATNTRLVPDPAHVVSRWHTRLEYGYPTPFVGRTKFLEAVQPQLEELQIYSRGRFGGWKYEVSNQDHSLMQGVEAVDAILLGGEELTYHRPNVVNANKEDLNTCRRFRPRYIC